MLLWVNGSLVEFHEPTTYEPLGNLQPQKDDLFPAQIGSAGAALRVSHLRLFRDLYYIAVQNGAHKMSEYLPSAGDKPFTVPPQVFFSQPERWEAFKHLREVEFPLEQDQFFMLGDNSAASKDGRLWDSEWPHRHYVHRSLLKGKAVFIYWPHSWDRTPAIPFLPRGVWFPMFPNVARMGFVR